MDEQAAFAAELTTRSADETRALGARLGAETPTGTLIALVGPLGAGKTQLAKGVAEGLGIRTVVNSPTFILMNEHRGRLPLYHVDAYRLEDPMEAVEAGLLDERHEDGVTIIEWADRLGAWLPASRIEVHLDHVIGSDTERRALVRAWGRVHADLASGVLAATPRAATAR